MYTCNPLVHFLPVYPFKFSQIACSHMPLTALSFSLWTGMWKGSNKARRDGKNKHCNLAVATVKCLQDIQAGDSSDWI